MQKTEGEERGRRRLSRESVEGEDKKSGERENKEERASGGEARKGLRG